MLGSMDSVAKRDQVRAAWWQKKQDKAVDMSRCRVAAHDHGLHAGFATVHHKNCRVTWLSHKTKTDVLEELQRKKATWTNQLC
jgi:hypothetical protein